ncbi:MAG: patatin-like phospholipase family protein [Defluviitaleaceae bacterium]|nr:patatin-like phospholipase family protein [Defluviitaleaceae bacterium]
MDLRTRKIGIVLSGGGIRATIYHLGVLKWLAENNLMESITYISSVSGGSLCAGLIYAHNNKKWPGSRQYLDRVLPNIEKVIMGSDIQISAILRMFPFWMHRRVNLLAKVIGKKWGVKGTMADLGQTPVWCANCTTYETGKRFGITQDTMGDIFIGYANNHKLPISDAMAASAGLPFLIGPYALRRDKYSWNASTFEPTIGAGDRRIPSGRNFFLWDGGVYDNLGLEALFHISDRPSGGHLSQGIDYIIVSNAGTTSRFRRRGFSSSLRRLLDIAMDQVGILRIRSIVGHIRQENNGMYLQIGDSASRILRNLDIDSEVIKQIISESLPEHQATFARNYNTTLRRPSKADYRVILRHGYEVAKIVYLSTKMRRITT